jgi:hypothetical protein
MMSREKLLAAYKQWQLAIKDALAPLLSKDKKAGITAMRVFYVTHDGTGSATAGQAGITLEGCEPDAIDLVRSIMMLLADVEGNRSVERHEVPKDH